MSFQSVPNCAEAVIRCSTATQGVNNVLGFFFAAGGPVQTNMDDLSATVNASVASDYLPFVAPGVGYIETYVRGLTSITDYSSVNASGAGPGTMAGSLELPTNVSFCITLRTAFTGRSARGRFYSLPFTDAGMASINAVTATYANGVRSFLRNLQAAVLVNGWSLVIISRFTGGAPRLVGDHFTVTNIDYRNLIPDSQRGRLPQGH